MNKKLDEIRQNFYKDLEKLNPDELKIKYLGRKSEFSQILRSLAGLDLEQKKQTGGEANRLRREFLGAIGQKAEKQAAFPDSEMTVDVTLPGIKPKIGGLHVISSVERELREIFSRLGFVSLEGPEVENDYYNFEALNIPQGHPARDMHDTFYVRGPDNAGAPSFGSMILRTHISPMQIRTMEKFRPPLAVISSGRVFRHEATDARHEHTWDYMEGFRVGENISLANLKYSLDKVLKEFFGQHTETRLRPSFFPFVEPGVEVAMSCLNCKGAGCKICTTGWLEIIGAGMIHPRLFQAVGYPAGKYTGFAFGIGLSRFAIMKYGIPDIRLLYKNDLRYVREY